MAAALRDYVRERAQGGVEVRLTVELLRRYAFLERSAIRALAGWFLAAPAYEVKLTLGHSLWAHAERVDALRARLGELRGGHRDANLEPALLRLGEELPGAPDDRAFLAGLAWLLGELVGAYRAHLAVADPAANAAEVRLLQRLLPDLEHELAGVTVPAPDGAAARWTAHLARLLAAAGGVGGLEERPPAAPPLPFTPRFTRPATIVFDARLRPGDLPSHDQKLALPFAERRLAEFETFFNEFYAAALLASILYDTWHADAPWAFFLDLSHQFWDEVRHAEFGLRRLRELGVEPAIVNQTLFEGAQGLPFLHRLCYLTLGLEAFFMPRKRPRVRQYEEAGDHRSQLFADVDWSDEINHVRYGSRWVEHFLADDARTVEELQEEIAAALAASRARLPAGQLAPF